MTSIPKDDPKQPCEEKSQGTPPQKPAAGKLPLESIFDAFQREFGRPLSEIVPHLSVEAKARVLDMLLARLEEQERASKGEGNHGANT